MYNDLSCLFSYLFIRKLRLSTAFMLDTIAFKDDVIACLNISYSMTVSCYSIMDHAIASDDDAIVSDAVA